MKRHSTLVLALMLGTACPLAAQRAPEPTIAAILAAPRLDRSAIDRLHDRAVLSGDLNALHAQLAVLARTNGSLHERSTALLVSAWLYWRSGDLAAAATAADAALAIAPGVDAHLLHAELNDAAGRPQVAADDYRRARDATGDGRERARLDLKLAIIDAMRRPEALVVFARSQPAASVNRIAPVLALLGQPATALAATQAPVAGASGAALALRQAEWAIAAHDFAVARTRAWQAHGAAANVDDRRYALALLVESYRDANRLAEAETFLATKPQTVEVAAARVDVLLELARFDAAIALVRGAADPMIRGRLLGILDLAGQETDSVAEYRRQIAADPQDVEGYAGLAAIRIAQGSEVQALAVWRDFFAANRGRTDLLATGARRMIAAGLIEPAITIMRQSAAGAPVATNRFLFEAYVGEGRQAEARAALRAIVDAAPGDADLAFAADAYDRLGDPAAALALSMRSAPAATDYDRQLRLADLAERAGRAEEALARWRAIWQAAALPARRSYAERQVVRLAKQTGRLEAFADDLAARVAAGTARSGEIDLLLAMRLAQGDRARALTDIERYAAGTGGGEAERLEQLAALYTRMRDVPALNRTLRRLVDIEPARRSDNLRRLILNLVRYGDDGASGAARQTRLDELLAMIDRGDTAAGRSFRAAVYADAGLDEPALAAFRAARAAAPADGDALLQLADALKKQRRSAEAGALLEQAMIAAPSTSAFAAAAGGLLDLLSARTASGLPRRTTLLWVERLVLERIVAEGDDPRTLGLLADLGQLLGDYDLQFRAYEASLSNAGDQRAAALRQLVTLSSGSANGDASTGPAIGDVERKLTYARRLIALRKSFPPDVYADIAGTLLAQGDRAGAERAFSMMNDMGGLVNVAAIKGRAYADRGLPALALANYSRALARDQSDLDLLTRTSILREQQGQGGLAFATYAQALERLIARQPEANANAGANDAGVEVDRYYATLVEGVVLNWPVDPATEQAVRADIGKLATATLAGIDRTAPGRLAAHRRLTLMLELVRRIVEARRDAGAFSAWLADVDVLFAGDADYRQDAAYRRDLTGHAPPIGDGPDWPARALQTQARDAGNDMLGLTLAIERDDTATVHALVSEAFAAEVAWRTALARGVDPQSRPPIFGNLLPQLMDRLTPERLRAEVVAAIDASPVRDDVYFDLFRSAPDRYARLEAIAGKALLSDQRLLDLLIERGNSPLGASARAGRAYGGGPGLDRFSTDQRVALYTGLIAHMEQGGGDSMLATTLLESLFAKPLNPAQQSTLSAALRRDIAYARGNDQDGATALLARLLMADAAPANQAALVQTAAIAGERYRSLRHLPDFLHAWFAGQSAPALAALYDLRTDLSAGSPGTELIDSTIERRFPAARQQEIDAFMATPNPDPMQIARFNERFVAGHVDDTDPDRLVAYYRKLIAVAPDMLDYRLGLARLYWQRGMLEPFAQLWRDHAAAHHDDGDAALLLIFAERLIGRADNAAATARASGVDPEDAGGIVQMLNRGGADAGLPSLFAAVYTVYASRNPTAPVVLAVAARRGAGQASAVLDDDEAILARLADAQARDPASVPGLVRALWRNTAGEADAAARRTLIGALVSAAGRNDDRGRAVSAIVTRADVTAELIRYPAALDPQTRAMMSRLYGLIAAGLVAQGRSGAELDRLLAALAGETIDGDGAQLLAMLADRTAHALAPAQRDALAGWLRSAPALGIDQRILLARVFARAGDTTTALGLLDTAMMQLLYPFTPLDDGGETATVAARIISALAAWPDAAAAREAYAELVRRTETWQPKTGGNPLALPPLAKPTGQTPMG